MKLGVGLDINCGVKRSAAVRPTYTYTGPTGQTCTGQTSRTLGVRACVISFHPCAVFGFNYALREARSHGLIM